MRPSLASAVYLAELLLVAQYLPAAEPPAWTPAYSMKFRNLSSVTPSPDGKWVVWVQREAVLAEDKSEFRTHLFLARSDGSSRVQLTRGEKSADAPQFSSDSKYVYFGSDRSGKRNLFRIAIAGGEAEQLTDWKGTMAEYAVAPDGSKLVFAGRDEDKEEEKRKKAKLDYRIIDDKPRNSSLWISDLSGTLPAAPKKLVDHDYHIAAPEWSPDGKKIAFVHRPRPEADFGGQSDISEVDVADRSVKVLAGAAVAEDSPRYSPDGRFLAFTKSLGTRRPDGSRIALLQRETGSLRLLAKTLDDNPALVDWTADSKGLLFSEVHGVRGGVYRMPLDGPPETWLAPSRGTTSAVEFNGTHVGYAKATPEEPEEAYFWDRSGTPVRVSAANSGIALPEMGQTELIRWKSKDGREVEGLLTYPVGYRKDRRVPLVLNIHGGPSGVFLEAFTGAAGLYPIAAFSANGIAVLRPNPRGSSGYGATVRQAVIQDWGGRDFEDLMTGVDHVISLGVADPERLAVMGWSYGGYMTAWTVTQTARFKAAAIGAGITNHISMYGTQDIPSVYEDYFGGTPWDSKDVYLKSSPIEYVSRVKTPTLILHGEQDDRVPITQAFEFHRALKRRGVKVKMITYPRTPHGPREPKFLQHVAEQHLEWAVSHLK